MKKLFILLSIAAFSLNVAAQTNIPVTPKPYPTTPPTPHRNPTETPSAFYVGDCVYVTFPSAANFTVTVTSVDGSFQVEETACSAPSVRIGGLTTNEYVLTITIDGMEYEGFFEISDEIE